MGGVFPLMKYMEELSVGETFEFNNKFFIVCGDYKKNGDRNCVNLTTGFSQWIAANTIIEICPIYRLDKDNNIIAIKPKEKENV